jgi:hypothetical protein
MSNLPIELNATEQQAAWDAAELETLRYGARMTFRQRLEWIEETLTLAKRFSGAASGWRLNREGNPVPVERKTRWPIAAAAVAKKQPPYSPADFGTSAKPSASSQV